MDPRCSTGRLGRRLSARVPIKGGSSMAGEAGISGEVEKVEAESDTSEGAPSPESLRETSEKAEGEGSGVSRCVLGGERTVVVMVALVEAAEGRAKESDSTWACAWEGERLAWAARRCSCRCPCSCPCSCP